MNVSVLIPYYQGRRVLLERSLWLLRRQTHEYYDVWILDDGSDESVEELCESPFRYMRIRRAGAGPRSSNMAWRAGYEACDGEFVILGHPEYMVPFNAIELLLETYDGNLRVCPTPYALSARHQSMIDSIDWKSDLSALQTLDNFWVTKTPWGWTNFDGKDWHHHFAFTGQSRYGWDKHGFLPVTEERGMNDSWLVGIEQHEDRAPKDAGFAVYHQHHERLNNNPFSEKSVRVQRIADSAE